MPLSCESERDAHSPLLIASSRAPLWPSHVSLDSMCKNYNTMLLKFHSSPGKEFSGSNRCPMLILLLFEWQKRKSHIDLWIVFYHCIESSYILNTWKVEGFIELTSQAKWKCLWGQEPYLPLPSVVCTEFCSQTRRSEMDFPDLPKPLLWWEAVVAPEYSASLTATSAQMQPICAFLTLWLYLTSDDTLY